MAILRTVASRRLGLCHRVLGASSLADRRSLPTPPFGAACEIIVGLAVALVVARAALAERRDGALCPPRILRPQRAARHRLDQPPDRPHLDAVLRYARASLGVDEN